jgi:hypothetical protein
MSAATYNFNLDQGADFVLEMIMKEDGSVKDLSGYSARAQMRKTKDAAEITATFTCSVVDPSAGKIRMTMPNATTGSITAGAYFYDLEIFTASDVFVLRLIQGQVTVTREITR